MLRGCAAALMVLAALAWARPVLAQTEVGPFGSCKKGFSIRASAEPLFAPDDKTKVIGTLLRGAPRNPVTIECDDTRIFADEVEWRSVEEVAYFRGNVVLSQSDLNVAAEKAEFHRATRNGTFYNATGTAHLTDRQVDRSLFGTLEPEVAFRAEKIEKTGPRTYKLTNGGFTTCAQPTPRWHMTGSGGTIVLDKRVLLKNAVLRVKDVPVFYVPLIYYPLSEDDRSTGFLIPTYTTSSIKGSGLSNAFFWAIDRSQDATFYHDLYSKTGQGYGGEYRFSASPGSNGEMRLYILDEKEQFNDVGTVVRDAHQTYDLRGHVSLALPHGFRLYGRSEYVSDITTKQLYQQNLAEASRRDRYVGINLNGNIGRYRIAANVEQRDAFFESPLPDGTVDQNTRRQGRLPQINLSAAEAPVRRSRLYFGLNGEMANLVLQERLDDPTTNHSLWRFDAFPTLRYPFSRLPYLQATAAGSWRLTHWLESIDPITGVQSNTPLTRQLLDLRMNVTGPIFSRIFQTPDNGYADRFKHVVKPTVNVRWLSPFDELDQVVKFDQVDYEVGGTTTVNYGIANELLARRKRGEGRPSDSRTILTATVSQSYYTKAQAAQYDVYYQSGSALKFSPLAIDVDGRPVDHFSARFRMEVHPQVRRPQLYSVSAMYDTQSARFMGGWRKRPVILGVPGFEETAATHYLNANATFKLLDGRVGGTYGFDYDIHAAGFVQQRLIGYYNAQCCGIQMDYQNAVINGVGQPNALKDRRFGISFTLAGIGSFANPFGAFGDNSGRR